ncbi:glutaredoxin family protein [Bacillus infantis]|uniref:glutaredoxin family protein n=1 Tax=Bacillus infantis TaxID=324767 RepID=UPI001CD1DB9C|nr:glutaredoxin family protein [Bacillus infantis]MCA1040390.1 glutaredoxin family protein [Bacillus infantis]
MARHMRLYTREGCHLCENAKETILALQADHEFELEEVDISSSDDLTERYGLMIPVVELDGEEVQYGRIDQFTLYEALTAKNQS